MQNNLQIATKLNKTFNVSVTQMNVQLHYAHHRCAGVTDL